MVMESVENEKKRGEREYEEIRGIEREKIRRRNEEIEKKVREIVIEENGGKNKEYVV